MIKKYELSNEKKLISTSEMKNFTYVLNPTREEIGNISEYYDFPFDYLSEFWMTMKMPVLKQMIMIII